MMHEDKRLLKLDPKFVEKVGEEKIEVFEAHVVKMAEYFEDIVIKGTAEATQHAKGYMQLALDLPEFAEHSAELFSAARLLILDRFCCMALAYAAETGASINLSPADLAHRLLQHHEVAKNYLRGDAAVPARGLSLIDILQALQYSKSELPATGPG